MKPIRILIAKPGLDGHDRGALVVAMTLRDAGMEVIYTGLHQSVSSIVQTAIDEDVDVIGLSVLSGAHIALTMKLMGELEKQGIEDVPVVLGGTIPPSDVQRLESLGVRALFPAGSSLSAIPHVIEDLVRSNDD